MDDALTIAHRFVSEPTNVRDLELAILRLMEHHIKKADDRWCGEIERLLTLIAEFEEGAQDFKIEQDRRS